MQGQGLGIYHQQLSDKLSMFIKQRSAYCGMEKGTNRLVSTAKPKGCPGGNLVFPQKMQEICFRTA